MRRISKIFELCLLRTGSTEHFFRAAKDLVVTAITFALVGKDSQKN